MWGLVSVGYIILDIRTLLALGIGFFGIMCEVVSQRLKAQVPQLAVHLWERVLSDPAKGIRGIEGVLSDLIRRLEPNLTEFTNYPPRVGLICY